MKETEKRMFNIICSIDNFLEERECNGLIELFEKNKSNNKQYRNTYIFPMVYEPVLQKLCDTFTMYDFKKIDNMEIVLWPTGSEMKPHYDEGDYLSFIVYLNDDYEGGETVINGITIKPKKGLIVIFSNGFYLHQVNKITNNSRYTLIAWYKNADTK